MLYKAIQAQIEQKNKYINEQIFMYEKYARIDRTKTTFGGVGILTKQQYEQAMSLMRKMKNMSSW